MSLFRAKEPREIKEDDSLLTKLWLNKRTHAMIVMGIYLFIFLVLLIVAKVSTYSGNKPKNSKNLQSISEYADSLNAANIMCNFTVNNQVGNYYISGQKITGTNVIKGSILYNGISSDIYLTEGKCYDKILNVNDPTTYSTDIRSCPQDINYNFLDYNYIVSLIKNLNGQLVGNKYYSYMLNNNLTIKVYYEKDKINKIDIVDGKNEYSLVYVIVDNAFDPDHDVNILNDIAKQAVKLSYDQRYYNNRRRVKINKNDYIENLLKLVAENMELSDVYQITIDNITETPVNIRFNAKSRSSNYIVELNSENFNAEEYIKE